MKNIRLAPPPPPLRYVVTVLLVVGILSSGVHAQGYYDSPSQSHMSPHSSTNPPSSPSTGVLCTDAPYEFTDVTFDDYFCDNLRGMTPRVIVGYTGAACTNAGYSSPCFLPKKIVTRAEFCVMMLNASYWVRPTATPPLQPFSDVPPSYWAYTAIQTAVNYNIVYGYPDHTFRPNNPITRAEMAKMVALFSGWNDDVSARGQDFSDVPSNYFAYTYTERLVMNSAVPQYPTRFYTGQPNCPFGKPCFYGEQNTMRMDAMMFLSRVVNNLGYGQVFSSTGGDNWIYEGSGVNYQGIIASVTTPDPPQGNGEQKQAPVGANNHPNSQFIESGPMKVCNPFCGIHPYGAWGNRLHEDTEWRQNYNISSNQPYFYESTYIVGDGVWKSYFYDGSTWHEMITSGSLTRDMPYIGIGVETVSLNGHNGRSIHGIATTVNNARFLSSGNWTSFYCYDSTLTPWRDTNGYISPCNNGSWIVSYPSTLGESK